MLSTYKRQEVLPRAIQSVVEQSMTEWEMLVVDDEPSDETAAIVQSFRDDRIQYLRHDQNRGLCAARNTGIRASKGGYIAFLDDDDVFLKRKLELQAATLDRTAERIGVASCHEEIMRPDGSSTPRAVNLEGDVHPALLRDDLVRMQLLLVRRVCFERVGLFDERLQMHDDFDMTLRLSRGFHFTTIAEPLVSIIGTPGSMSTDVEKRVEALETMMTSHPELREQRRVRARWERRLARHHAELGNPGEWRRLMLSSLRSDPLGLSTWVSLAAGVVIGPGSQAALGRFRGRVARARRAIR